MVPCFGSNFGSVFCVIVAFEEENWGLLIVSFFSDRKVVPSEKSTKPSTKQIGPVPQGLLKSGLQTSLFKFKCIFHYIYYLVWRYIFFLLHIKRVGKHIQFKLQANNSNKPITAIIKTNEIIVLLCLQGCLFILDLDLNIYFKACQVEETWKLRDQLCFSQEKPLILNVKTRIGQIRNLQHFVQNTMLWSSWEVSQDLGKALLPRNWNQTLKMKMQSFALQMTSGREMFFCAFLWDKENISEDNMSISWLNFLHNNATLLFIIKSVTRSFTIFKLRKTQDEIFFFNCIFDQTFRSLKKQNHILCFFLI